MLNCFFILLVNVDHKHDSRLIL